MLTWATASETSNADFDIERSTDNEMFEQVGFKPGVGTTTEAQTYRFTDSNLPFEVQRLTYRLKQIDTDGTEHLSPEITVQRKPAETQLMVPFPNPARQHSTVRFAVSGEPQEVTIQVYDLLGRVVQTVHDGPAQGCIERVLDTSDLPSGTYFLRLQTGGRAETQRLTIAR